MKLAVIGGGGVRTPLLMSALARRQDAIGLQEVQLMDMDDRKLSLIAPLCAYVAQSAGARFRLTWSSDADEAMRGAGAVITTIRVGGERARARDERIALDRGVLGQETTGPGGFAMALRSIPAIVRYAARMRELCPDAWLLNFTNPAGLVAQALTEAFPDMKIAGICDTPSSLWRDVASLYGRKRSDVPVRFFGLNHLSWMPEALVEGENVVPKIVEDPMRVGHLHELAMFEPSLLQLIGMLPNEYLYYYYYRDRALANVQAAGETRGEQVVRLSGDLVGDLERIDPATHPEEAWRRYRRYRESRHGSYMALETGQPVVEARESDTFSEAPSDEEGEGYAGVALDILQAANANGGAAAGAAEVVANVPSRGAVPGMREDDVVEVSCTCDAGGLHPVPLGDVPEDALLLMQQVKRYERLTVQAIEERSRSLAVEALMAHPLVGSYPTARSLVDAYLETHGPSEGEWADA